MNKKLNLKWVADTIGDEYKLWKHGDIVKIQAQTGTGKTFFIKNTLIPYLKSYERLIYVCNRTNLKRQLKKDLLFQFGEEIPYLKNKNNEYELDDEGNRILDINAIDSITTINNITITSYHSIQSNMLDAEYNIDKKYQIGSYDYIVLDECHYIFADGAFNNKCRLAFEALIKNISFSSTTIFISATMEEIDEPISISINKYWSSRKPRIWNYTTGIDYSYVNTKYFKNLKDLILVIKNDKTNDKWLIFVSNLNDAEAIIEAVGKELCTIIKAGDKNDEVKNIVNNSKFNAKILITTKAMDNGININDDKVTNIVIMAWDKITFIQMLGRKRIDINNAQEINLYINTRYKKSFEKKLELYNKKKQEVILFSEENNLFNRKYDNNLDSIGKLNDLFYRNKENGQWSINKVGDLRLDIDKCFAEEMVKKFKKDCNFAFIKEQLKWLNLKHTFDESNLLEDVILQDDIETLENYLNTMLDKRLYCEEQQKLSDLIIKELLTISKDVDYRTKKLKRSTIQSILTKQLNLPYVVSETKREDRIVDGKRIRKNYIIVSKMI
ncbi:DEAD/DEAH box helicase family protein [Clostridium sp. BSD9I1]|uniref:DEAD/DEAH box helicase family protein n=1 Tax=Clostridium sp. BSD9I1 TaxID=2003589 RepID=UPI0016480E91|nr:DEAD/DEAH box helicase family protein [Clostridium sp. BSD9I1]